MTKGVAVTGMGIVSALGMGVDTNLKALLAGNSGICYPTILETAHSNLPVGEIKVTDKDLAMQLKLPQDHTLTRGALLGCLAAREALEKSGITKPELSYVGFISATSVGGMDYTEKYFNSFEKEDTNRKFIQAQHPGFTTGRIKDFLALGGFTTTISTACSSSANAIMLGARMIKSGQLKRVVVGGTDPLSRFTLNGFNSLMILSSKACKPFDEHRNGLNLGEGAAYLVLEADDSVGDKNVLGRVTGYGNANDAYHQTASSETGNGAFLAMKKALYGAGVSPVEIEYINAHGTATHNNDLSESRALLRIFGDSLPAMNSTKAYTGHTLAAAGAVEAVFSLLSLKHQTIFPGLNFRDSMPETGIKPITDLTYKNLKNILSNSFGFGGNCTSLIISNNEG
ncbi:beta-ketoacyl-[acyl-carrier-protein] synthase family protein [Antarcticibacterium flavum]|uniref:Beta-ketoacyl-[acyl-carrier-protein] synthase family protein n=1 Tax=Antarcticibacterium flavum TaxID=2058175 RepID=A0A5B7WYF5_9FLAO|nr:MULTISPECIES: beta-ketoacyl-[acyl-carrier-protein] synthase family protein [Antarcticibacterium]MCM4158826.1 beta-ketoacyl-[acyl-carrier-protein] synthase family protein [Antarcticibacterium sp. W02-3]QCY68090.1 beta-ketoacyl-[acyl-carrier-protein] synthase family protein [Antarcticibacterium flavum]